MSAIRPFKLFGFRFGETLKAETEQEITPSFVPPTNDDSAISYEVGTGGSYHVVYDFDGTMNNEADLINKYREMSMNSRIEPAIDEIINDMIIVDKKEPPIQICIEDHRLLSKELKDKIQQEFNNILRLMNFKSNGYDIVRKWYIDGRFCYHVLIDKNNPTKGIQELRYIDPRLIKKFREVVKKKDPHTNVDLVEGVREYYVYNRNGFITTDSKNTTGLRLSIDSIVFSHSGLSNPDGTMILSHLNQAIRPYNLLRNMEDSLVIYRMTRAPERRIFNIDVGEMTPMKSKAYIDEVRNSYRSRMLYNPGTGELRDDRKHPTITEDFWFPKRGDGRSSEVTTLPGGQNLSEISDVEFFQRILYQSLKIPVSRLDPTNGFNIGKASEISREEVKFSKFITRLRFRFNTLFNEILKRQLILKKITTAADWEHIKECIYYDYLSDSHFAELKNIEIMNNRLECLDKAAAYTEGNNKYFSEDYIKHNILMQTDQEVEEISKSQHIEKTKENGREEESPVGNDVEELPVQEIESPKEKETK